MNDLMERLRLPLADCLVLGQQRGGLAKIADAQLARAAWVLEADARRTAMVVGSHRLMDWADGIKVALEAAGIPKPEGPSGVAAS